MGFNAKLFPKYQQVLSSPTTDSATVQALLDAWFEEICKPESGLGGYRALSRLPEGAAAGRVVCLGSGALGANGERWVDLAYGNPPSGEERRAVAFGVSLEAAPAVGQSIRLVTMGLATYSSQNDPLVFSGELGDGNQYNPGDTVLPQGNLQGAKLYLRDGDAGNTDSQGLVTTDASESTGNLVVGISLKSNAFLFRPYLQVT